MSDDGKKREWARWFLIFSGLVKGVGSDVLAEVYRVPGKWKICVIPDNFGGLALLALNPDAPKESAVYQSGLFRPDEWATLAHPAVQDYANQKMKISLAALAHHILELN